MRQRVELARVLAGDSDILLMDEPFSALDYQARLRMRRELIRLLAERPRTVVFVTHDIEEAAQLADRVLVLSNRPATICRELQITAPRPRGLTDPCSDRSNEEILNELGLNCSTIHKEMLRRIEFDIFDIQYTFRNSLYESNFSRLIIWRHTHHYGAWATSLSSMEQ